MSIRALVAVGSVLLVSVLLPAVAVARPVQGEGSGGDFGADGRSRVAVLAPCMTRRTSRGMSWSRRSRSIRRTRGTSSRPGSRSVGPSRPRTDLVASSVDNGKTWTRSTIPGLTVCTGGTWTRPVTPGSRPAATAPSTSADSPVFLSSDPPSIAIVASHSPGRRGASWAAPVTVAPRLGGNETPAVTGSLTQAGHAYMAWANFLPSVCSRSGTNTLEFSRTTDGGSTWSSPVPIDQPSPFQADFAPRIIVLPDGTLVAVFARVDVEFGIGTLQAARSLDEGQTWQLPVQVGSLAVETFFHPERGEYLPQSHYPSAAVAPTAPPTSPLRTTSPPARVRSAWPNRGTAV